MAPMQHNVTLSVVIPALNEEANLAKCVESVADASEIIVADGGSRDKTRAIAKQAGCRLVSSREGRGFQLRAGAAAATGDLLVFLHADSWLANGSLHQLREYSTSRANLPVVGCFQQRIEDPRRAYRIVEFGNAFRASRLSLPYGDQAMFVDRETYHAAGGFPSIPIMEDVVLSRRLGKFGRPTLLPGPVHLSARRWHAQGVLHQTLRNWIMLLAFSLGVSPARLTRWYR